MDTSSTLDRAGLFTRSVPRYTSYPTATMVHSAIGGAEFCDWPARSDPAVPLSIYLHIPIRACHALFSAGSDRLMRAGYQRVGFDHFAQPDDPSARAGRDGRLRRNFQGYTDDPCDVLIGFGALAISRFPQGYTQNAASTATCQARIREGRTATSRSFRLGIEDRLRARAMKC